METIASLCIKHNVICISDEVYEHITYERNQTKIGIINKIDFKNFFKLFLN
jgi:aspartate/methionine/tyrosine aminotransferase